MGRLWFEDTVGVLRIRQLVYLCPASLLHQMCTVGGGAYYPSSTVAKSHATPFKAVRYLIGGSLMAHRISEKSMRRMQIVFHREGTSQKEKNKQCA